MSYSGLEGTRPYRGAGEYYSQYRPKPSDGFVRSVVADLGWGATSRILDLGCGPGRLALRFAPFVQEVTGVDIEQDMVDEAIRQASALGVDNVRFLVGDAEHIADQRSALGTFEAATIGEAFHWMVDRDGVLSQLSDLLDADDASVLLITTGRVVDAPDLYRDREQAVDEILERCVAGTNAGPHPRGRHDAFEDILTRSSFSRLRRVTHRYEERQRLQAEESIGLRYTISHVLTRLGDARPQFEAEVVEALASSDGEEVLLVREDAALIGTRDDSRPDRT